MILFHVRCPVTLYFKCPWMLVTVLHFLNSNHTFDITDKEEKLGTMNLHKKRHLETLYTYTVKESDHGTGSETCTHYLI